MRSVPRTSRRIWRHRDARRTREVCHRDEGCLKREREHPRDDSDDHGINEYRDKANRDARVQRRGTGDKC